MQPKEDTLCVIIHPSIVFCSNGPNYIKELSFVIFFSFFWTLLCTFETKITVQLK